MKHVEAIAVRILAAHEMGLKVLFVDECKRVLSDKNYTFPRMLAGYLFSENHSIGKQVNALMNDNQEFLNKINSRCEEIAMRYSLK